MSVTAHRFAKQFHAQRDGKPLCLHRVVLSA
jgi:hypothetical protein